MSHALSPGLLDALVDRGEKLVALRLLFASLCLCVRGRRWLRRRPRRQERQALDSASSRVVEINMFAVYADDLSGPGELFRFADPVAALRAGRSVLNGRERAPWIGRDVGRDQAKRQRRCRRCIRVDDRPVGRGCLSDNAVRTEHVALDDRLAILGPRLGTRGRRRDARELLGLFAIGKELRLDKMVDTVCGEKAHTA